jgi:molybdopterin-binding protein
MEGRDLLRRLRESMSTRRGEDTMKLSARNQVQGTVRRINEGAAIANVELDVQGQRLVASVTVEAVKDLELAEGDQVIAVIKASDVILAKP